MKKHLICLLAALAAGTASAQEEDLRTYCGDLAVARGEPRDGTWALQCSRTLQVQRDRARQASADRSLDATIERNEWLTEALRNTRLVREATTEADRKVAEKNVEASFAACPTYYPVARCVRMRDQMSNPR